MIKKIVAIFIITIFAGLGWVSWEAIIFLNSSSSQNVATEDAKIVFEVPAGTSFHTLAAELFEMGVNIRSIENETVRQVYWAGGPSKSGGVPLKKSMTPREILNVLVSGQSITYQLTVPEGFNLFDIRDTLNSLFSGKGDIFFDLVNNQEFIQTLTGEKMSSLEGYLFPETYTLTKYTSMETLVRKMYELFRNTIAQINANAKVSMPLKDQVILASVIEKETGAPEERPLISSVFHNRLRKKMRLQSDPTILYGLLIESKEMKKNITKADILRPTPYNTYTIPALPIAPIANPGRDALWAAVNPVESNYLYFVSQNNGTHVFSESLEQHNEAVRKFQLDKKMREGSSWRDLQKRKDQ